MKFTSEEKRKLLDYVANNLTKDCGISIAESKKIVNNSMLVDKINTSPYFVAHSSIGQLTEMVKKEVKLVCI